MTECKRSENTQAKIPKATVKEREGERQRTKEKCVERRRKKMRRRDNKQAREERQKEGKALDNASREVWSSREEEDRSRGKRKQGGWIEPGRSPRGPLGRPWAMVRLALPSSSGFLLDRIW